MKQKTIKEEILIKLGKKFKESRKKLGLSLRKLDADIGIDHSYIAKIERGEENLTIDTIAVFLKKYQLQPNELFDFLLDEDFEKYFDKYNDK
jgi:transcriptional regulator with XRE-family HTH domain